MKWLLASAVVLSLAAVAACGNDEAVSEPSASATIEASAVAPPPFTSPPAPTPPADLEQRISECVVNTEMPSEATGLLKQCLTDQGFVPGAGDVAGEPSVILLDVHSDPPCFFTESFILWRDGQAWQVQSLEPILSTMDAGTQIGHLGYYSLPDSPLRAADIDARTMAVETGTRLGVVYASAACGSGPREHFLLLGFDGGSWSPLWNSAEDTRADLGHAGVAFASEGIDGFGIEGSSWFRHDPKSRIFAEANAGPHRYFTQAWVRRDDGYELVEELVTPSSYNSLVEFVYRLRTGDHIGAAELTNDAALADKAISLGLDQDNGQVWSAWTEGGTGLPPWFVGIRSGTEPVQSFEHGIRLEMVESSAVWSISAIEPF